MPKVVPEYKEKAMRNIIKAGASVFAEKGYHLARMDDIAKKLGVSKGAIYQYFKSKEHLFYEVVDFFLKSQKDEVLSIILSEELMRIASTEFIAMKIERALQVRAFGLDLFIEASRNDTLRIRVTEMYEKIYDEFLAHIDDLKKKGVIKKHADVGVIWRGIVALRDGLLNSMYFGANAEDVKKTWTRITTLLLKEILTDRVAS
ncbi:MAG: TetR/AcrR family transcriptional regulator [Promethearchaeota archaeon]